MIVKVVVDKLKMVEVILVGSKRSNFLSFICY